MQVDISRPYGPGLRLCMPITIRLACIEGLVGAHGNNRELSRAWGMGIESRFLAYSEIACFDSSVD